MPNEELKNVPIKNLRLWSENPRYSLKSKINIQHIGEGDFEIEDDSITRDDYEENYSKYQARLLNNLDSIKATQELIESLANVGFRSAFDDMFVVKPKNILGYKEEFNHSFDYIDKLFYVVEGNRRLLCIDLLQDNHNSRSNLRKTITDLNKFGDKASTDKRRFLLSILTICDGYDKAPTIGSLLDCKAMDFDYYTTSKGATQLNEILNSRHFGNRKGKLNWPRGLILRKIFALVKYEIISDPRLSHKSNSKKLHSKIEDYVGKRITSSDINSALFVNYAIQEWNDTHDEKIKWEDTETGDIDQVVNNIEYNEVGDEVSSSEHSVSIYVSSLENARSNIKIRDSKFGVTNLGRILKFDFKLDKISDNSNYLSARVDDGEYTRDLKREEINQIIILIVEAVKNGEITTRSFGKEGIPEVGVKIRKILFPQELIPVEKALSLSIDEIMGIESAEVNPGHEVLNSISKNLRDIEKNFNDSKDFLDKNLSRNKDNLFKRVLWFIWKTEYGRIIKFKGKTQLRDIPTFIFSLLYRSTFEFIQHTIGMQMALDYLEKIRNKSLNLDNEFDKLMQTNFDNKINSVLSNGFLSKNIKKYNGDFLKNFMEESRENQFKMIKDVDLYFDFVLGLNDFLKSDGEEVTFNYFGKHSMAEIRKNVFFDNDNNGFKYLSKGNQGLNEHEFEVLKDACLNNNFFGKLNSREQVIEIFNMIHNIYKPLSENDPDGYKIRNLINRVLHKPLSALLTYDSGNDFEELNLFVETLKDTEKSIMKILK